MVKQRQPRDPVGAAHPGHLHHNSSGSIPDCDDGDAGMSTSSDTGELSEDWNSSGETSGSASSPTAHKAAVFGPAKAYFKQKLGVLLPQKPNESQASSESPPQKVPVSSRRKKYREELLAQPSMLVIPPLSNAGNAQGPRTIPCTANRHPEAKRTVGLAAGEGATFIPKTTVQDRRRPAELLARVRPQRHLLQVEPSIPEETGSFDDEFGGGASVRASNTQDEVEREDTLAGQILEVFPDADERETYRLIREGQSVRRIISDLCSMRLARSAHGWPATAAAQRRGPGAFYVSLESEIDGKIQQIKEAFPDVDVDRSYALLQRISLNSVMVQLAEESMNDSSAFSSDVDVVNDDHEERQVHFLHDAFLDVDKDTIRDYLRRNSISTVVAQLCSKSSAGRNQDDLRRSLMDYFQDDDNQRKR